MPRLSFKYQRVSTTTTRGSPRRAASHAALTRGEVSTAATRTCPLLNEHRALEHAHSALKGERAGLFGGHVDVDRRVQGQIFFELELGKHDLFGAGAVGRAHEDECSRLARFDLDLARREALAVDDDLGLLDAGGRRGDGRLWLGTWLGAGAGERDEHRTHKARAFADDSNPHEAPRWRRGASTTHCRGSYRAMACVAVTLSHLWPSFPLERILYEDDDLIVIDKPVNVSTHAPDAGRTDDAVSRLKTALGERDRVPAEQVYLGIHQRLDRDTSGVLLFTRRKSANAAIAAQFEGRKVKKTYRAGVVGWPRKLSSGVLTH